MITALLVLSLTADIASPAQLEAALDKKIAPILPSKADEAYLEIPWRLNLMKARQESFETGKPMFVWVMDGHVLGCT